MGTEYEARDMPRFFERFLAAPNFNDFRDYLLAYELQKRYFVRNDQGAIQKIRSLASSIQSTDPPFKPLRNATHNRLSAAVRMRMRRDPAKQPYLIHRIAGGAVGTADVEVYSKTGTWGPIFADAGIVRHRSERQIVLAVFIESRPAYRGNFIAALARRSIERLLASPAPQSTGGRERK